MARLIRIAENIKQDIAEKVAQMASRGYIADYQGSWYVVDGVRLMHHTSDAPWTPWMDNAAVIHVNDLVEIYGGADTESADFENSGEGEDYALTVEFALSYVPDSYDADDYAWRSGDE